MIRALLLSMYYALWPLWNYSLLRCEVKGKAVGLENLILQTLTVGECASWCVRQWNKHRQESIRLCLESPLVLILWVVFPNWMRCMWQVLLGGERDYLWDWFPWQNCWCFSGISSLMSLSAWQPSKLAAFQCPVILIIYHLRLWFVLPLLPLSCHSFNGKENTDAHYRRKQIVLQSSPQP